MLFCRMRGRRSGGFVESSSDIAVVVVAAGRGVRAGGGMPKQYRQLAGRPVLTRTIEALATALPQATVICAIHPGDRTLYDDAIGRLRVGPGVLLDPVAGGVTRQDSVRAALEFINNSKKSYNIVLIHDSVRPFIDNELLKSLIEEARRSGAAAPGLAVTDALKQVDRANRVERSAPRDRLFGVQTPQAFAFSRIFKAHGDAAGAGVIELPDDAAVAEWAGLPVTIVPGSERNFKLTTIADFQRAEALLMMDRMDIRMGTGFDVHAFAEGDGVWLGGVRLPFGKALSGHSDADVVLHALTDAVLGAIGAGDIGMHFPPSDPQWKGASSDRFLRHAVALVDRRGGVIGHLDVTIICEAPKIGPHRNAIRDSIAAIAGLPPDRVSVKATTTEKLGFTGRGEGIAAQAAATVRLPFREMLE